MENKFLTIAIPTYNRPQYLKECLDILCPQLNDEIKIVVRDNCSSNYDFPSFIKPYVDQYSVIAVQNSMNIGGDASVARCFEDCDTDWICILGDDDYIQEGGLIKILHVLKNNQNSIFVKFNSKFSGSTIGIEGFAQAMTDHNAFNSVFFSSEGFHNIGITGKNMYAHYLRLSSRFPHLLRVLDYLIAYPESCCYFSNEQILKIHGGEISWSHDELIIPYLTLFDLYIEQFELFKSNIYRCVAGTLLYYIENSNYKRKEKISFVNELIVKYGMVNIMRYNYRTLIYLFVKYIFRIDLKK